MDPSLWIDEHVGSYNQAYLSFLEAMIAAVQTHSVEPDYETEMLRVHLETAHKEIEKGEPAVFGWYHTITFHVPIKDGYTTDIRLTVEVKGDWRNRRESDNRAPIVVLTEMNTPSLHFAPQYARQVGEALAAIAAFAAEVKSGLCVAIPRWPENDPAKVAAEDERRKISNAACVAEFGGEGNGRHRAHSIYHEQIKPQLVTALGIHGDEDVDSIEIEFDKKDRRYLKFMPESLCTVENRRGKPSVVYFTKLANDNARLAAEKARSEKVLAS